MTDRRRRHVRTISRRRWRAGTVTVLAAVLVLVAPAALADDLDDLQQQQEENEAQQESVESALEGTNAELTQVYLDLQQIEIDLPIAQAELAQAEDDLAAAERHQQSVADRLAVAEAQQAQLEGEITQSETDIVDTESAIGELARSSYRGGDDLSALSVVLDAASPEDFADRYSAVGSAMRSQTQVLDDLETLAAVQRNNEVRLEAVRERIAELKVEADEAVAAAAEARQRAADKKAEIERLQRAQQAKAAELEDRRADYEAQQARLESDNAELAAQIREIQRQQEEERRRQEEEARRRAAQDPGGGGGGGGGGGSGSLIPPVSAPFHVTSPYGYREYPITGGWFFHPGTDIRSGCGASQVSAAAGTVVAVRGAWGNGTHGNQVMVDHGVIGARSYLTVYNHLSGFAVSVGQSVGQGQVIGYTGQTGGTTGCHVHIEVWVNGSTINPETLPGWTRSN